ncbi:MAG: triple tyrosine motif-containing protein, partial [Cyclobacteriaceae bacterium]
MTAIPSCIAQAPYRFKRFSARDGLAYSQSRSIVQDTLGYIWIRHLDGLSRFDGISFKQYKYDRNDTLRSSLSILIDRVIKDRSGKIYLVGSNQLLRYNYQTDGFTKIEPGLDNTVLQGFEFEPDNRHLWIATFLKGIYRLDTHTGAATQYFNTHPDKDTEALQNDVNEIADLGDALLLVTIRGLWLFDKDSKTFKRPDADAKDTTLLYNRAFTSISRNEDNTYWLSYGHGARMDEARKYHSLMPSPTGENSGFIKIDRSFRILKQFYLPDELEGPAGIFSKDDILWTAKSGIGLYRFDPGDGNIEVIRHDPSDPESLSSNRIFGLEFDREGNLWIATIEGVNMLRKRSLEFYNIDFTGGMVDGIELFETSVRQKVVLAKRRGPGVIVDNPNDLWISDVLPEPPYLNFQNLNTGLKAYAISHLWPGKNYLWTSAPGAGFFGYAINAKSGTVDPWPQKSFQVIPGNKNSIGYRLTTAVYEDPSGDLWAGNKNTGLYWISSTHRYGEEGSIINFRHSDSDTTSISHNTVWYLYPESESKLWVVTDRGVDLLHWNKQTRNGWFEHVYKEGEMPNLVYRTRDNTLLIGTTNALYEIGKSNGRYSLNPIPLWNKSGILAVQEDRLGRWWLHVSTGLVCYDRQNQLKVEFNETDGLKHMYSFDQGRMRSTKEGIMIMADPEGVSVFDPSSFTHDKEPAFPILTSLKINNKTLTGRYLSGDDPLILPNDISFLKELVIDYQHNNFAIDFSAMEMTAPEKNLYRHKLEGFDKDWIETDYKNRTATYTNLPAGEYTFRVKASNHHGIWSENERTLKVVILPPPWRTWWAYSSYGLLVTGLLVWARRNIVQRERLKSNLKLEHLELEKAKEVDKLKTSFFTNISHEFRTPLTLIKGPVQSMIEQFVSDQQEVDRKKIIDQLKLIQRNSDLLLKLINQLLDLAKLESGTLKVEKSEGEVFSFVRAVASSFESMARQKGITLVLDVPAESQPAVFDKDKLETILINLVNNAIKFTGSGGTVSVEARCRNSTAETQRRKELELIVRDTGIGIPAEHQS